MRTVGLPAAAGVSAIFSQREPKHTPTRRVAGSMIRCALTNARWHTYLKSPRVEVAQLIIGDPSCSVTAVVFRIVLSHTHELGQPSKGSASTRVMGGYHRLPIRVL